MGLDKLRLVSRAGPREKFLEYVNAQLALSRDQRRLEVRFRGPGLNSVDPTTMCTIFTRKGVSPPFYLQLNFQIPGNMGTVDIFELNPNKFLRGIQDFDVLVDRIFGDYASDLKVSRIDVNADIGLPVEYFRQTIRIPRKRKSRTYYDHQAQRQSHSNRGVTGFYVGRPPSQVRVYDKRQELREQRRDVSALPDVWTRVEWEYRHGRTPIRYLAELPQMLDFHPFDGVEFVSSEPYYDFHNDCHASLKRYTLNSLAKEYGVHDAVRILNYGRNFKRDYRDLVTPDSAAVKDRLQSSYLEGTRRFFEGRAGDLLLEHMS